MDWVQHCVRERMKYIIHCVETFNQNSAYGARHGLTIKPDYFHNIYDI